MLWRVQYRKTMGLVRSTATEPDRDAAIERALRLYDKGYPVVAVGTDEHPAVFNGNDIRRLFAYQRSQQAA
jgi:hypothetical protein